MYEANPPQARPPQQSGQYEKNPNGGYLNQSNYGADSWYGKVTLTPELTGLPHNIDIMIEAKDIQVTEYGPCRRCTAKPWVPKEQMGGQTHVNAPAGFAQPTPVNTMVAPLAPTPNPGVVPQPVQYSPPAPPAPAHSAPQPVQHVDPMAGDIPF